ncbi:stage II sporulation protein M [Natronolimnobius baerhuensis]|uniref:Stage II sporulation protein M n=1 Tax=Natronolimnobius baerhuensis TaxID=253108 RepID=A0A202EBD1_9EURY|nr:stage II sporulation protein M [Natronolimnobius baerhuensis]OVE85280.1 hypothetical protein B2G88_00145 [Natronolimnobius baerhuensis]
MAIATAVRAVGAVFRRRPADILPLYVLGAAVPAIIRVIPFIAAFIGYYYLETTGRLEAALAEFETVDPMPDPQANPDAFEAWFEQLLPILELLFPFPILVLAVGTVIVGVLGAIILYGIVTASQLSACYGRLRDERGLVAGIAGARRYWLRIAGLYVLEFFLWAVVLVGGGIGATLFVGLLAVADPLVGVLMGLLVALVFVGVLAVIRALFAFAPVAVVVDDAGIFDSVSSAGRFIRAQPVGAIVYYVVSIGAMFAISTLTGLLALVEVTAIIPLLSALVLLPALDLLKSSLYVQYRGRLTPPAPAERPLRRRTTGGLRHGWTEMVTFVRGTLGTHAIVVALALVSFWVGWRLADPYTDVGVLEASIAARLEGHMPPAAALEFFGNNWLVALMTAFGGLALAIPAIFSLVFNGVFLGVMARLEVEPLELLAFVIPHGIFEIPAIFIATVVGISLGIAWFRAVQGRLSRVAFADRLERAFWVLIGVGILLAIAAVVEGFISPYYYDLFL